MPNRIMPNFPMSAFLGISHFEFCSKVPYQQIYLTGGSTRYSGLLNYRQVC